MIAETELKKQFEDMKDKSISEKNYLHNVHAEEKLELMKVRNINIFDLYIFLPFYFNFPILSRKTCTILSPPKEGKYFTCFITIVIIDVINV